MELRVHRTRSDANRQNTEVRRDGVGASSNGAVPVPTVLHGTDAGDKNQRQSQPQAPRDVPLALDGDDEHPATPEALPLQVPDGDQEGQADHVRQGLSPCHVQHRLVPRSVVEVKTQNEVPKYPDWYFGLAARGNESLSVTIYHRHENVKFNIVGKEWDDVTKQAQQLIRRWEALP